jgi:hypothetical protein
MLGGFALVIVFLSSVDVAPLYFLDPIGVLPGDIGGFATICWLVLIPVAVTAALVLQTPAILTLRLRGRVPPSFRSQAVRSGEALALLGASVLFLGIFDGAVAVVLGSLLLVEGVGTALLAHFRGKGVSSSSPASGQAPSVPLVRFRGQTLAFLLLFGFGCFPSARSTLPAPRPWWEADRTLSDLAFMQAFFLNEHGRFAKHLSELGWEPSSARYAFDIAMTESQSALKIDLVFPYPYGGDFAFGADRKLRCAVWVPGYERGPIPNEGHPTCRPPRPRGADASDIGPSPVMLVAGFPTLFIGVPAVLAGLIGGVLLHFGGKVEERQTHRDS